MELNEIIQQQAKNMAHLLSQEPGEWSASPEFIQEFSQSVQQLVAHYVKRAALFGEYRVNESGGANRAPKKETPPVSVEAVGEPPVKRPRKGKKLKMKIRESDFDYAWQTIEQDARTK